MKYVSPVCEMAKLETEDVICASIPGITGVDFSGATNAVDTENTVVTPNADGGNDISVGIYFSKLNSSN